MASQRPTSSLGAGKTYFEQQREAIIGDIAMSFEHVLANINKLNRSLEAIITVGNEFSSVEALWSQFEGVMGKDGEEGDTKADGDTKGGGEATKVEETGAVDESGEGEEGEAEETVVEERGRR
ncbi:hypothetical protein VUR80DRAFT_2351 [Thermomyces stellatus]